ncbi:MAG: ammonium transporter [Gammaproteobacteria bacterium]|nr:ammonium transporter [Gammaproteobacteria bacterium]
MSPRRPQRLTPLLLLLAASPSALASDGHSTLSVVWVCICSALVLFMQPGFACLEAGLARAKNSINVIMKNLTDVAVGSIVFWAAGYGLMFGTNATGWLGMDTFLPDFTDPTKTADLLYQTMFAATAATIVSGAVAERIRFIPYVLGAVAITALVYPIFGSWVWGGDGDQLGWLRDLGFHDAAGGTVVHSIGGWCALGAVLVLGPRLGRFSRKGERREIPGHNLPLFALGGFILWFGWFGFNGGAAKADFSDLGLILLNTNLGAAAGIVGSLLAMMAVRTPILMTNTVNGALGGLVAITAGCNVMEPPLALLTGLIGGALVIFAGRFLEQARIDDVVGAISVHGVGGAWGTLAVAFFYQGDMFNIDRILIQTIGIVAAFVWAVPLAFLTFKVIDTVAGLRASSQHEQRGLDYAEHYEIGYSDFMAVQTHAGKGA